MADSKRFSRESIGVIPGRKKKKRGLPSSHPSSSTQAPTDGQRRVAAALEGARREFSTREQENTLTGARKSGQRAALANVTRTLESLPVGSMDFGRQVTRNLWQASPADIRRLATIVEAYPMLSPAARQAVGTAVLVREQTERLAELPPEPSAAALLTRAAHWSRLEDLADQTRKALAEADADEVSKAAVELLPESSDLLARSRLAESMAEIADALSGQPPRGAALALPALGPSTQILADTQAGKDPSLLALEVGAAVCLTLATLDRPSRGDLDPLRGMLARVSDRLEQRISQALRAHHRDPEAAEELAALRRNLRRARSRLDEAILDSAVTAPLADDASSGAVDADQQILDHLARIERQSEPSAETAPTWKRWLGWGALGGAVLLLLLIEQVLPSPLPPVPDIEARDFAPAATLTRVDPAGALLVATADPSWEAADAWSRRQQAVRLMSLAEEKGFRAGLLIAVDGRPLASWSPGRPPTLRQGTAHAALVSQSRVAHRLQVTMFGRDGKGGIQHAP